MTKDQYLNHPDVRWVRDPLAAMLASLPLEHRYYHFDTRRHWSCRSVRDAAENYFFPIRDDQVRALWNGLHGAAANGSLFQTSAVLDELERRLRRAVDDDDAAAAFESCDLILRWGGVTQGNRPRLERLRDTIGLVAYLRGARALLTADEDYAAYRALVAPGQALYCNAGFTKIYSLLGADFLIYDSRVAAALGMLIANLCRQTDRKQVPDCLRFLWMPARSRRDSRLNRLVPAQLRNPSTGPWKFKTVRSDRAYLTHNIRAGWLLRDVTERTDIADWPGKLISGDERCAAGAACCTPPHPPRLSALRALETALFMIGYDLSGNGAYPVNRFAP